MCSAHREAHVQDKSAEKRFFDDFATHSAYDVFDRSGYDRFFKEFSRRVEPRPGESVLDVGCGTGAFTAELERVGLNVTGMDLSLGCCRTATHIFHPIPFLVGDAEALPFSDHTFDILTFSGILHHLPELLPAVKEAHRVLKPGGRVFAYDPNLRNPAMWLYRSPYSPIHTRKGCTENERLLTWEEPAEALRLSGFDEVKVAGLSGVSFRYAATRFIKRLLWVYNVADLVLEESGLGRYFGAFLISSGEKHRLRRKVHDG